MQDIFLKLWDRPGFGLWREIVEDWDERSLDADSLEGWQISKLLHLSFPGQPFPRRFLYDVAEEEEFRPATRTVCYDDESGCMLTQDGETLVACIEPQRKVRIPDTVKVIGSRAFSGCNVHEVLLPDGLRVIEPYAFHCSVIRDIELPGSLESIGIGAFGWTFPKYLDDYLLECDGPTRLRMEENSGPYEVVNDCLIERIGDEVSLLSYYYPYWCTDRMDSKRRYDGCYDEYIPEPGVILFAPPEGVTRLKTDCIMGQSSSRSQLHIRLPRSLTTIDEAAVRDASVRSLNIPRKLVDVAHDFWRYVGKSIPGIYELHPYTRRDGSKGISFGKPLSHFPLNGYCRVSVHSKNPRYYIFAGEFHIGPPVE